MIIFCNAVVPHVTNAIMEWVERIAKIPVDGDDEEPQVCIIEVKCYTLYSFVLIAKFQSWLEGLPNTKFQ